MEEQHVHSKGFGEIQVGKLAGQSKRGEGHHLPRQQEPPLVTGAYSYLLVFELFHISLRSSVV